MTVRQRSARERVRVSDASSDSASDLPSSTTALSRQGATMRTRLTSLVFIDERCARWFDFDVRYDGGVTTSMTGRISFTAVRISTMMCYHTQ